MVAPVYTPEKLVAGEVPRFSAEAKIIDKREVTPHREVYLIEKRGRKYIVAVEYQPFGDDGGFIAGVWSANRVKGLTYNELFEALHDAEDIILEDLFKEVRT